MLLEQPRIAPEEVERLVEQREMLVPRHEHRGERRAEVGAVVDADRLDRGQRVEHLAPDRRGSPAPRSTRTKCSTFSARRPRGSGIDAPADARARDAASQPDALAPCTSATSFAGRRRASIAPMSSWYLSSTPSVSATVCGSSATRSSAISASAQSSVSATPGALNRSIARSRCTNATISRASDSGARGHLRRTISSSRSRVRIVDPVVEAAPLDRVVDLARAVRRDHDDRRLAARIGAELGNRHLVVGQHLEQVRLERLVGAIELVDQQHRRDAVVGRERLQQRALQQEARR